MTINASSVTFVTAHLQEVRQFYARYFETWYPFDSGWYVLISLEKSVGAPQIGFMEPRDNTAAFSSGAMLNLVVDHPDELHQEMLAQGETIVIPLADNPWGDRGFGVLDPAGVVVYCHKEIPASEEFRRFIQKSPDVKRGS